MRQREHSQSRTGKNIWDCSSPTTIPFLLSSAGTGAGISIVKPFGVREGGRERGEATLISQTEGISFTRERMPISFNASPSLPPSRAEASRDSCRNRGWQGELGPGMAPTAPALGRWVVPLSCSSQTGANERINSVTWDGEQQGERGKTGQGQLLCPF